MATKNNPGPFDCYSRAEPDEPMFVLLGRDPCTPLLIGLWVAIRRKMGESPEKLEEARACITACTEWILKLGKLDKAHKALAAYRDVEKDEEGRRRL